MARLILSKDGRERTVVLATTSVSLGRAPDCTIALEDHAASKRHCSIERIKDAYVLRDLGSTNGTFLNDRQVIADEPLRHGDEFIVGDTQIRFEDGHAVGSSIAPPPDGVVLARVKLLKKPATVDQAAPTSAPLAPLAEPAPSTPAASRIAPERLRSFLELTRVLLAMGSAAELCEALLRGVLTLAPVERGVVFLVRADGGLAPQFGWDKGGSPSGTVVTEAVLQGAVKLCRTEVVPAVDGAHAVAIPLVWGAIVRGALWLETPPATALSPGDLELLDITAAQAAALLSALEPRTPQGNPQP